MSRNQFLRATDNQSLSHEWLKLSQCMIFWTRKPSNLVSLMKTLALMSRWYLTTTVIHVSNWYVRGQFVWDKIWVLAKETGVPYKIKIYQRRTNQPSDEHLVRRVVKNALKICKNPKECNVYFDNFFSSYSLICDLATNGNFSWQLSLIQGNWHNEKW